MTRPNPTLPKPSVGLVTGAPDEIPTLRGKSHGGPRPGAGRKPKPAAIELASADLDNALSCLTHAEGPTAGLRAEAIAHVRKALLRLNPPCGGPGDPRHAEMHGATLPADVASAIFASCAGESSVTLEALSGGQIKPKVTVVHRDPDEANRQCQAIFDDLAVKYWRVAPAPDKAAA